MDTAHYEGLHVAKACLPRVPHAPGTLRALGRHSREGCDANTLDRGYTGSDQLLFLETLTVLHFFHVSRATNSEEGAGTSTHPWPTASSVPRRNPQPTHRAVAHAGGRGQRLLQGLALLQCARRGGAGRPLAGQQVLENVAVAPQRAVNQCTLAFLI